MIAITFGNLELIDRADILLFSARAQKLRNFEEKVVFMIYDSN
jgi:hypothetical protein